jgi:hypothetical protein
MMFTGQCVNHNGLNLADTHVQMEEYESLGKIKTFNVNMHQRYKEITEARCIVLEEKDADFIFQTDFLTPPSVTWEWIHNPEKRNIWNGGHVTWLAGDRRGNQESPQAITARTALLSAQKWWWTGIHSNITPPIHWRKANILSRKQCILKPCPMAAHASGMQ